MIGFIVGRIGGDCGAIVAIGFMAGMVVLWLPQGLRPHSAD